MSSYTPSNSSYSNSLKKLTFETWAQQWADKRWVIFLAAVFLVSVPVFFEAPLVRLFPGLSLALTGGWLGLSLFLGSRPATQRWGDLLFGFTWTWMAGSIYWGWFRWEPLLHLPIEAIGLPLVVVGFAKGWGKLGHWFYLGSLFGTAMTDLYFYLVDLIPHWRRLMLVEPNLTQPIFQSAVAQMQTPSGMSWAIVLVVILLTVGSVPLLSRQLHWWAFGGAVLSTLLVDGLFWLVATAA
ncbi:DUF3120 domain-containing protein [Oculatella sp. LEGE 06141]|uniref:DUF3120 domain-containing protein n=1 Tax=Oculatella sp. LEGE 06141 TaxID=1828648 RepID=UPI001D1386C8|nr:DUF3120 domain-containing protein [Oculatella sp. LEGE 06141]